MGSAIHGRHSWTQPGRRAAAAAAAPHGSMRKWATSTSEKYQEKQKNTRHSGNSYITNGTASKASGRIRDEERLLRVKLFTSDVDWFACLLGVSRGGRVHVLVCWLFLAWLPGRDFMAWVTAHVLDFKNLSVNYVTTQKRLKAMHRFWRLAQITGGHPFACKMNAFPECFLRIGCVTCLKT